MAELRVELLYPSPQCAVLVLSGQADARNYPPMMAKINAISASRPQRVVIDMSGLEFLSSLPLGELVAMSRAVKLHGGRVVIAGARPAVREMLSHVRIDQIMPCFDGVDSALSAP